MAKKPTKSRKTSSSKVTVEKNTPEDNTFFGKLQNDLQGNQSYLNLILGALIVIVLGVLLFNYFTKPNGDLGTAQQSTPALTTADASKDNLPGKYTVKEGDTLFTIAQKYYDDGYKYPTLVAANKLTNENSIQAGQVLDIPKLEEKMAASSSLPVTSPSSSPSEEMTFPSPSATPVMENGSSTSGLEKGMSGADNQTTWGEKITTRTYTVQSGDWLSKIADRAYGDVYSFDKIAKANNIQNPDNIEVGMILQIPR